MPLGEVLRWLEQQKEEEWGLSQTLPTDVARSGAVERHERAESAYGSLNRVLGYLVANDPP